MSGEVPGQVPEEILNAMTSQSVQFAQIARQNYDRWYRSPVDASMIFRPATGTLTTTGAGAEARIANDVRVQDSVTVELGASASVDPAPTIRPGLVVPWLDAIAFFIPKSIREPFLGDLREDLADMATQGHSRARAWWAAISQVAILALRLAWSYRRRG